MEAYFDTCHSGTGLRAADLLIDRIPRYLPPPTYKGLNEVINSTPKGLCSSAYEKDLRHHILWAACKDNETSSDAQIEGAWHGAFTFYFVKRMNACQNKLSRAEILNKVKADLKKNGFAQNPQLEANATARKISVQ